MGHGKSLGSFDGPPNFLICPRLGHQTKTHVNYILHKDINNKSKQNYPNYQMQMMLLRPVLCFIQQLEMVESQQIQPTGGQLSIVIGDECVGGIMCVNTVPVYIYNVHSCKFILL
jgi:hypothetical protein